MIYDRDHTRSLLLWNTQDPHPAPASGFRLTQVRLIVRTGVQDSLLKGTRTNSDAILVQQPDPGFRLRCIDTPTTRELNSSTDLKFLPHQFTTPISLRKHLYADAFFDGQAPR